MYGYTKACVLDFYVPRLAFNLQQQGYTYYNKFNLGLSACVLTTGTFIKTAYT
jgi:hypothetical protein